ncbi:MAG: FKBP-type peptidyl-prolyl cis-trans isomerase [Bacteroidetes bacterium]|nr:FKBP-type peptidyl-prolyl cis-trans isomerase [Bacteroidota bacterium]
MMKSVYTKSFTILLTLFAFLVLPGCGEEVDESVEKLAQEQRYFDLYMGSHFKDTIAAPTGKGLYYIEMYEGTGDSPGDEDWVLVNHVTYTIPEDIVVDTYIESVYFTSGISTARVPLFGPYKMQNGTWNEGFTEGLTMMREGGGAIMCFTSELGFGSAGTSLMRSVASYTSMKYEVELLEVIGSDIEGYELARMESYVDTIIGVETLYDSITETVMYYVVDSIVETGNPVVNDSVVEIAYKGYLIDGRVFDESAEGSTFDFTVGDYESEGSPIIGWQLGVTGFREGEKGRLIIPYQQGYGENGSIRDNLVSIPPYETLVFDIEVVSVSIESDDADPDVDE